MPKTKKTVSLWVPSVAQRQATNFCKAGCHLPARMTAGESVNVKTAL